MKITQAAKARLSFANAFVTMQEKRHAADYDPNAYSRKSEVAIDIEMVERVIDGKPEAGSGAKRDEAVADDESEVELEAEDNLSPDMKEMMK